MDMDAVTESERKYWTPQMFEVPDLVGAAGVREVRQRRARTIWMPPTSTPTTFARHATG